MSPHPEPLVRRREAQPHEVPRTAAALQRAADGAGWKTLVTYAHGTWMDAQGRPTTLVESIRVRMQRDPLAAVGAWNDGKFLFGYVWSRWTEPKKVGARQLSAFVKDAA